MYISTDFEKYSSEQIILQATYYNNEITLFCVIFEKNLKKLFYILYFRTEPIKKY